MEQVNLTAETGSDDDSSEIVFAANEADDACNSNHYNPLSGENDKPMIIYDWLADTATMSHVTNMRDAFTSFTPLIRPVRGVGNAETHAEGRGTIKIRTKVNEQEYDLTLTDVLYIPTNQQNLLSLGRWDKAGGEYHGGQGQLMMITRNGDTVATGTWINNHLYRLNNFIVQAPATKLSQDQTRMSAPIRLTQHNPHIPGRHGTDDLAIWA